MAMSAAVIAGCDRVDAGGHVAQPHGFLGVYVSEVYMGILSWIILGLIAGFIGSRIVDRRGQGFWLDIVLGIIGALVGGFLFDLFGASGVTGLNIYSMLVAVAGSVAVLLIYNAVTGRRPA
jgi:uncharacterized membrane protein YeaQ/YmgE (transglycosylase-associated protein family)